MHVALAVARARQPFRNRCAIFQRLTDAPGLVLYLNNGSDPRAAESIPLSHSERPRERGKQSSRKWRERERERKRRAERVEVTMRWGQWKPREWSEALSSFLTVAEYDAVFLSRRTVLSAFLFYLVYIFFFRDQIQSGIEKPIKLTHSKFLIWR